MRTMLKVRMDTATANAAIADGSMGQQMQEMLDRLQPEAAYFFPEDGRRAALFVVDMADPSDIPGLVEPFWLTMGADVQIIPVMNADDLRAGLARLAAPAAAPVG